ncbi:MAG: helix-turn-helix domain-containing protein [Burkholderiales bacterium]|nr:helix-turn-helix domain-containing protein [Burkholderiales bacterium]
MQAKEAPTPDYARIKRLVEAAADKQGGLTQLAQVLGVTVQLVSNWKQGVKTPSPEAQAELAHFAGQNALVAPLMAMIEKSTGPRKQHLQVIYRDWMRTQGRAMETIGKL